MDQCESPAVQRTCACKNSKRADCRLLIHTALRSNFPVELVHMFLCYAPDSAMIIDKLGSLPIHIALENKASKEILLELIDIYPACCKVKDRQGLLPLHIAVWSNTSTEVIERLVKLYPGACSELDFYSFTPICLGAWNSCSIETLSILVETYPEACREKNTFGSLPLHCAVQDSALPENVALLLKVYPQACREVDNDGNYPIHGLTAYIFNYFKRHHKFPSHSKVCLELFVKEFPESVHMSTTFMKCPLEIFFENKYFVPKDIMRMILNSCPSKLVLSPNLSHIAEYRELNWQARKMFVLLAHRLANNRNDIKHACHSGCICVLEKIRNVDHFNAGKDKDDPSSYCIVNTLRKIALVHGGNFSPKSKFSNCSISSDIFRCILSFI